MRLIFALCILVAAVSKVKSHGGLAIPLMWTDDKGHGDNNQPFGGNGCRNKGEPGPLAPMTNLPAGKTKRRLSTPNCYFLFLNDGETWAAQGGLDLLDQAYGQNIPRMPREMFVYKINNTLARYGHLAKNADYCSSLDLTTTDGYQQYASNRQCKNPWHRPGFSKITSPCGVSGGLQTRMAELYPFGQPAETYSYPNAPTTTWKKGKRARVVWNVHANHAGGYSYRLCKVPTEGIIGLTEECFQQTPLDFAGKFQKVRAEGETNWTKTRAVQTRIGTWPEGSMWRKNQYFVTGSCMKHPECLKSEQLAGKNCGKCRGQIEDFVKVPATITTGDYVLSWRWDAEGSPQIWNGCSNIKIA